ncbi:MAG: hypothetical protein DMG58_05210 [Acidobacteria bacterium]|nr:MAG: hypothetical protein DMG58_05210 [Acidobacteriota bacterium]
MHFSKKSITLGKNRMDRRNRSGRTRTESRIAITGNQRQCARRILTTRLSIFIIVANGVQDDDFLDRFFLARARFQFASSFNRSSFETVRILRRALSIRSASVLPGTFGAGNGFIPT